VTPILCGDHATGAALTEKIFRLFANTVERDHKALAGADDDQAEKFTGPSWG
jgi:hypothetical protein